MSEEANKMELEKYICGIYKITSPSNKIYIGKTINLKARQNRYKNLHCKGQAKLYRSLRKYGWEKHKFEIIEECLQPELDNKEKYYIDLFNTFNSEYGLNLKEGGQGGKMSDETKKKISESNKGKKNCLGFKHSLETRLKMSIERKGRSKEFYRKIAEKRRGKKASDVARENIRKSKLGDKNPMFRKVFNDEERKRMSDIAKKNGMLGRKMSQEFKEKCRIANTGRKQSLQTVQKRILKLRGKKRTDEQKERYRLSSIGKKMPDSMKQKMREINTGKKHSEETKKRISDSMKKYRELNKVGDSNKKTNL
jgi:hypothetical protein